MARLRPFFSKGHGFPKGDGKPRVDDRRVLGGVIFINRNGLPWSDAPKDYGPAKTLYNRWKRWGGMGVFARMMEGLTAEATVPKTVMINTTCLKAYPLPALSAMQPESPDVARPKSDVPSLSRLTRTLKWHFLAFATGASGHPD
jgi:transposase